MSSTLARPTCIARCDGAKSLRLSGTSIRLQSCSGRIPDGRRRALRIACQAGRQGGGANDLNVNGKPPTSPGAWQAMQDVLKDSGVKCFAPQEVVPAQERGVTVIDIRPKKDFDEYHIPDSINIEFYRPIAGWSGKQTARRLAFAFFGVFNGTEYNPNFIDEVMEAVDPEKGAILVCNQGGSKGPSETADLDPDELTGTSKTQTRSLMAAYELTVAGVQNLSTLRGGFSAWIQQGRDVMSNVHEVNEDGEWIS